MEKKDIKDNKDKGGYRFLYLFTFFVIIPS